MKKYLIFDLDGTLIKSNKHLTNLVSNYLYEKYSIDKEAFKYYLSQTRGTGLREQLQTFMKIKEDEAKDISEKIYELIRKSSECDFFEGVPEKIKELSKSYKLFLSTGNSTLFAKNKLQQVRILDLFEFVLGSEEILKGEDHIEVFKDYIGDNNFEKKAVLIGDGQKDRQMAKISGIDFIHIDDYVKDEYNDKYEINSVASIDNVLDKINNRI